MLRVAFREPRDVLVEESLKFYSLSATFARDLSIRLSCYCELSLNRTCQFVGPWSFHWFRSSRLGRSAV